MDQYTAPQRAYDQAWLMDAAAAADIGKPLPARAGCGRGDFTGGQDAFN
jgi:hypothetical protein